MHWHKLNNKGKTTNMTANPLKFLFWRLRGYPAMACRLPYTWFDRKANRWRGSRYNHDGICINAN